MTLLVEDNLINAVMLLFCLVGILHLFHFLCIPPHLPKLKSSPLALYIKILHGISKKAMPES